MRALLLKAPGQLVYTEAKGPSSDKILQNTVRIRIHACGICGSDIPRAFDEGGAYHYPLVLGHEFSGFVDEDNNHIPRNTPVAIFPLIPKPGEPAFSTGDYAQTRNYDYFGSRRDGGMQEYLDIPFENLFPIPDHLDPLHAACTEPAAVALHGVRKFTIEGGENALVIGAGPIGTMAAQWLKILGCRDVFVADVDSRKLEIADSLGLETLNAVDGDIVEQLLVKTNGKGVDKSVEACGHPKTFVQAIKSAATFGEVLFLGNLHGTFEIGQSDFSGILRKELVIHGTWNSKVVPKGMDDWSTVLRYMDRELKIAPLISDTVPLHDGEKIFKSIRERRKWHNKVLFQINS